MAHEHPRLPSLRRPAAVAKLGVRFEEGQEVVSRDSVLQTLAGLMDQLREDYGVKRMGLFGSVARRGADSESDIDLLVEFERPIGFFRFLELEDFLTDRLGHKVDLVSRRALKPRIGARILEEVVDV